VVAGTVLVVLIIVALIYAGRHQPGKQDVAQEGPWPTRFYVHKPHPEAAKPPTHPKRAKRLELPPRGSWPGLTERSDGLPSDLLRPGGALHPGTIPQKAEPTSTGAVSPGSTASVSTASGGVGRTDAPKIAPEDARPSQGPGALATKPPAPHYAGGLMPAPYDASVAWEKWARMCEADGGRVSTDHQNYWQCRPDCAGQAQWNFAPCPGWKRPDVVQYQSGDGGGSTADAPAAEAAAPGPGPGPGDCK